MATAQPLGAFYYYSHSFAYMRIVKIKLVGRIPPPPIHVKEVATEENQRAFIYVTRINNSFSG